MEENVVSVNIQLSNYMVERLKTFATNKSKKIGKDVVWQDIFNQIFNHPFVKDYLNDVIEDQLVENLDLVEEKSKDNSLCNSCDVIYYIERGFMRLMFDLDLEKAALIMSSSEDKKLKEEYTGHNLKNVELMEKLASRMYDSSDEFKLKIGKYALELFIETISESVNEELMRDKNCWE